MENQTRRNLVINNAGMTEEEMLKIASMRYDGLSWEHISLVMRKDFKHIAKMFRDVLSGEKDCIPTRNFDELRQWMFDNDCSSKELAEAVHCNRSTINSLFEAKVSTQIVKLIAEYTGLDERRMMREYFEIKGRALERERDGTKGQ